MAEGQVVREASVSVLACRFLAADPYLYQVCDVEGNVVVGLLDSEFHVEWTDGTWTDEQLVAAARAKREKEMERWKQVSSMDRFVGPSHRMRGLGS